MHMNILLALCMYVCERVNLPFACRVIFALPTRRFIYLNNLLLTKKMYRETRTHTLRSMYTNREMNKKKISSLIQKKWPWKGAHKSKRITKKTRRKEKSWNWRSCRSLRGMCVGEGGKKERHLMDSLFNFQIEWRTFTSCCKTPHSLTEIGQLEAGAISISSWILPSLHTPFRKNSFFFLLYRLPLLLLLLLLFCLYLGQELDADLSLEIRFVWILGLFFAGTVEWFMLYATVRVYECVWVLICICVFACLSCLCPQQQHQKCRYFLFLFALF